MGLTHSRTAAKKLTRLAKNGQILTVSRIGKCQRLKTNYTIAVKSPKF